MRNTFTNILDCFLPLEEIQAVHGRLTVPNVVAGALCRAMKHKLPLALTLRGAAESERLQGGKPARILLALAQDIEAGVPLADALERHAGRFLPPHIVPAVRAAEARGQLPAVLPALAEGIERGLRIRTRVKAALTFPLIELAVLLALAGFLFVFIFPKIHRVFEELLGAPGAACRLLNVLTGQTKLLGMHLQPIATGFDLLFWGTLAFVTAYALAHCFPALGNAWAWFWETTPVVGPVRRQIARLELADTLSAATAGNGDLLGALRLGHQSSRSPHLRKRLAACIAAVEHGEPWAAAWEAAGIGAPFENWILRNAAARQDPFTGFMLLRDWLAAEVERRISRVSFWLEPCMTCLNSALVAALVFAVWQPLTHLAGFCFEF